MTRSAAFLFAALRLFGQQLPDPNFSVKVATPAYREKGPVVLIDAAHNNVHTADGSYKTFADLISSDGCVVRSNQSPFQQSTLADARILVIANARGSATGPLPGRAKPAFTAQENDAVQSWVRGGGALLLVADHWPIGPAMAELSMKFEVVMGSGYTHDPKNQETPGGDTMLVFSRENKLLLDHPITSGLNAKERLNRVVAFTGQSLTGPAGSSIFMKLSDTAFDTMPPKNDRVSSAGRAQGLALEYGKGRVVVIGEAAMLSAQLAGPNKRPMGMNAPNNDDRQLALNVMHWLSRVLP